MKIGSIKIGTADIDFRPVHYRDSQGNRVGIDIDLMNLIASKMNVKLDMVFIPRGIENRFKFLIEDQGDLIVSNFSITPDREEKIDFSIPYLTTGVSVLLNKNFKNVIRELDDLKSNNIRISLIPESTQHKIISERFPNIKLILYQASKDAVQAFFNGESDGYATDELFLRPVASQNPDKYYLLPGKLSSDPYGVGVSKKYPELRTQVSMIIEEAIQRGEMKKIIDTHTSVKIEPQTPSTSKPVTKIHIVEKGDSLEKIASRYYGKASLWNKIYESNRDVIPSTLKIQNGMRLKIHDINSLSEPSTSIDEKSNQKDLLEYITYLHKQDLISKEIYDEVYENGRRFIVESQLLKLRDNFSKGLISKETYHKEQLSLLRGLF